MAKYTKSLFVVHVVYAGHVGRVDCLLLTPLLNFIVVAEPAVDTLSARPIRGECPVVAWNLVVV